LTPAGTALVTAADFMQALGLFAGGGAHPAPNAG